MRTISEQLKWTKVRKSFVGKNFNDFEEGVNSNENKEVSEAKISLNKSVESSLKAFDKSLKKLQPRY